MRSCLVEADKIGNICKIDNIDTIVKIDSYCKIAWVRFTPTAAVPKVQVSWSSK